MQLHLFSVPGEPFLTDILLAAQQILANLPAPVIVYIPAAAEERHFVRETKTAFRSLAEVRTIKPEIHTKTQMLSILERASLLFIPGGNTYLAAQRLHTTGLMDDLRERILGGIPLVAFSAGTVLCGVDILTSNDPNNCGCSNFAGFGLVPFNFNVHYPAIDGEERLRRDARLQAYAASCRRTVLALEDGAYIIISKGSVKVVKGLVWKVDGQRRVVFGE
jgi:dipeptidase E